MRLKRWIHFRNESQPSVFVHTAAQDAFVQPGNGRPNAAAVDDDVGLEDVAGEEEEEDNEDAPPSSASHQGAIPKTPKPNYTPPNYVPK